MIFTCDVEDWFHAENIRHFIRNKNAHSSIPLIYKILDFLSIQGVKGTFFVLGEIAQKYPEVVLKIKEQGHEIASHGMTHTRLDNLTEIETRFELSASKDIIENLIGAQVLGFRSPCFSTNRFLAAELVHAGYKYTSNSIAASFHERYRYSQGFSNQIHDFALPVANVFYMNLPASGGGWFRLFPVSMQKKLLRLSRETPKVFYCHPWDFDDKQPLRDVPHFKKWRHNVNAGKAFHKLKKLDWTDLRLCDLAYEHKLIE